MGPIVLQPSPANQMLFHHGWIADGAGIGLTYRIRRLFQVFKHKHIHQIEAMAKW